eukprot:TRINITY_DN16906_c0_g1_i1.p1 TRINITY_DN16906_c0_g1~~TRINITY_DN16906_c0_g1_i1.p1  ORF type:complete len:102 (+),score=10.34 TRINITY_DN16906_c0_g1_i1:179-484(+)
MDPKESAFFHEIISIDGPANGDDVQISELYEHHRKIKTELDQARHEMHELQLRIHDLEASYSENQNKIDFLTGKVLQPDYQHSSSHHHHERKEEEMPPGGE